MKKAVKVIWAYLVIFVLIFLYSTVPFFETFGDYLFLALALIILGVMFSNFFESRKSNESSSD